MAVVSRLVLNHPALGTAGGASLHSQVEALYTKIGDAISSRWYQLTDFDQTETVDLEHNFDTDIANLRYDIYVFTGGQWVNLTNESSPARSAFTVVEKVGFEDNILQITNNTGGNDLLAAVVIHNDPMYLQQGDIKDVDISTVPPEEGQALVYEASSKKFKPGASGDASFKVQSVAANGTTVIKGGYLIDDAGHEYATYDGAGSASTDFGVDISFDLDSIVTSPVDNTTYNLYIDKSLLSGAVTTSDNSRKLIAVTGSHLVAFTTAPDAMALERYIPLGFVRYTTGGVWSTTIFSTFAFRRHQDQMMAASPLVATLLSDRSVGAVGAFDDGYGPLAASDFPGLASITSWYPLTGLTDGSTNARDLTNTGSVAFVRKGFYGRETLPSFTQASGKRLTVSNSFYNFNTASAPATFGGWFYKKSWAYSGAAERLFTIGTATSITLQLNSETVLRLAGSQVLSVNPTNLRPGWHHFAFAFNGSGTLSMYVDGQLIGTQGSFSDNITGSLLTLGANQGGGEEFKGTIQDFFFTTQALTAAQIMTLYSKRYQGAQVSAGHVLTTESFSLASLTDKVAFFNLRANGNDGSVNAKNLTNNGTTAFTGADIFGVSSGCAQFDGVDDNFSSTDAFFNPGNGKSIAFGGWFSAEKWQPSSAFALMSQYNDGTDRGMDIIVLSSTPGNIRFVGTNSATTEDFLLEIPNPGFMDGSWHHFVWYFDFPSQLLKAYIDGVLVGQIAMTNQRASSSPIFRIGAERGTAGSFLKGRAEECFFMKDVDLTDNDIKKLYATRIDLSSSAAAVGISSRLWEASFESEDGQMKTASAQEMIVNQTTDKVWADFGQESGEKVTLKLYDGSLGATAVPVRKFDRKYTTTPPTTIAHSLPAQPTNIVILYNENADGKYRDIAGDAAVKSDGTNIYVDLSSYTIDSTHDVRIVASIGTPFVAADTNVNVGLEDNGTLDMIKVSYLDPVDGTPNSFQFRSAITRRAKMVDITRDLMPRIGIERFLTQEVELVEGETASLERVFKPVNDKFEQIRFIGEWQNLHDAFGQRVYGNSSSGTLKIEVQWVGTGLNILLGVDNSTSRDLRVSIDGGAEGGNIFPASMSGVIHNRNYSPNPVVGVTSGLSYGLHTAVFRIAAADMYFYGFEFLNESTSIKINPGTALLGGIKRTLTTVTSTPYNSDFESGTLGTRGGRGLVYINKTGTVGKAVTPAGTSQLNLAAADHTNEEITRITHPRQYGAGRTDDFSRLTVSTDVAFTVDDASTTLIGNSGVSRQSMNGGLTEGFLLASNGVFMVHNFIGTGLDVEFAWVSVTNTVEVFVDGVSVGNLDTSDAAGTFRLKKIVSGLPCGSHTVKFIRNSAGGDGPVFKSFVEYGPKKPDLPVGALALGEYYISGDLDTSAVTSTTGAAHALEIPKGVISKTVARENLFVGSWSASLDHTGNRHGWIMFSSTIGNTIEHTFMGTGVVVNVDPTGSSRQFNFKIDGVNQSSATIITGGTVTNNGSGNYTVSASNGGKLYVSGLAYGKHTVLLTLNSAVNFYPSFDIIAPVYAFKNNGPFVIQNVAFVGSCGMTDLRYFGEKLLKTNKVSRQFPVAGINTSSTSEVANGMGCPIYLEEDSLVSCYFQMAISNNVNGQNSNISFRVDGRLIEIFNMQLGGSLNTPVNLEKTVFMRKGHHYFHVGWLTAAGILTMPNLASGGTEYGTIGMRKVS